MASIYDKASLVLIPSGTKTSKVYSQVPTNGDGDFTFSRSTAATRVNADGNIEKETQNLLLQSNDFDTTWLNQLGTGGTITGGQAGYDGSNDAWLISKDTSTFRSVRQVISSSGVQTYSAYVKAGTLSSASLRVDAASTIIIDYNLSTGSVSGTSGTHIDNNIEDVGNGWYRISVTFNASITNVHIYADKSGTTSGNIYIQDAQLEQGLVARDYIETTTAAVEGGITDNVPRLDYTDSSCPALLLEPQRTNVIPFSEYSGSGALTGFTTGTATQTITNNYTESPEGFDNAIRFQATCGSTINDRSGLRDYVNVSLSDATLSFYMKSNTGSNQTLTFHYAGGHRSTITATPEWQRFEYTEVSPVTSNYCGFEIRGTITDTNVDVSVYGFQMEVGSYATSYIPTYGSAVTRNNEQTYKTSATDLIGQTEGTMYAEFSVDRDYDGTQRILMISNGSNTERIGISIGGTGATGSIYGFLVDNNTTQASIISSGESQGTHKAAFAYKENDFVFYLDGVQIGTDNNGTICTTNRIDVGRQWDGASFAGDINQVLVFKTRLSNEELADLTTL